MSILIIGGLCVGRCFGSQPRAKTSMTIMRPPQHGQGQGSTRGSSGSAACCLLGLDDARAAREQLAGAGDVGGTVAVGEQAIVADAVEALGQHVHQEAADELVRASVIVFQRSGPRCGSPSTGTRCRSSSAATSRRLEMATRWV